MAKEECPWVHSQAKDRQQEEKEIGGGGGSQGEPCAFIDTHAHVSAAMSHTLPIFYPLIRKPTQARGGKRKEGQK